MKIRLFALLAISTVALAGCGEYQHSLDAKERKYAGRIDTQPWKGEAPAAQGRFTAGDKASWESALRARAQNQNEYVKSP
ncbi:MAG TPA: hypothetical protein VFS42_12200 [Burkholderiaceae bacterium]|nr:hypothetical protein [Burkholderiaceae bacterium]